MENTQNNLYYSAMKISTIITGISHRTGLFLCALFSFSALSAALIGQYGFGLHPCDLCIYQRIPYALIIVVGLTGIFIKSPRRRYIFLIICAILFLADAGIAGYHTGVEQGIFKGPSACSSNSSGEKTLEELRAEIMNAPLVSCSQAMVYIFGLSMAAWNMIAALIASTGTTILLLINRRNIHN